VSKEANEEADVDGKRFSREKERVLHYVARRFNLVLIPPILLRVYSPTLR